MKLAAGLVDFQAVFFSGEELWLAPSDAARFQLQRSPAHSPDRSIRLHPPVMTIGSLERRLLAELPWPELDEPSYDLLLYELAGFLARPFQPDEPESGETEAALQIRTSLAVSLGDGLSRLKLAGLSWEQVAALPPRDLAETLADLGRRHDARLRDLGRLDRSTKRRRLLEWLRAGRPFKNLAGVRRIVYRQAQRLSPFETEFLLALAVSREVELVLKTPAWVRDEDIRHGAGFDLLRAIRRLEGSREPGLNLEFAAQDDGLIPPALAYAADFLLAPGAARAAPAPDPDGRITIVRTPTAYHEVEEAGRRLKKLLLAGLAPEEAALVPPSLEEYGPMVEDVGRRFGLAFNFRYGPTLAESGPARAALDLLAVWGSKWERERILELIRSPYFQLDRPEAGSITELALAAGVTDQRAGGGFEDNLTKIVVGGGPRRQAAEALLGFIGRLKKAGRDLAAAEGWPAFIRLFRNFLTELGWPGRPTEDSATAEDRRAAEEFQKILAALAQALETQPVQPVSSAFFRLKLKTLLRESRPPDDRGPEGRVWVLNYYDLHGASFETIFFLGLNERIFPKTSPESRWWPEEFIRAAAGRDLLGRSLWSDAADRYRQEELLLSGGLGQAKNRVWLFHHALDETGRPVPPSPLLGCLRDLWPAEDGGSRLETEITAWRSAPDPAEAAGQDELRVGLAALKPADWPSPPAPGDLDLLADLRRRQTRWRALSGSAWPGPAAVAWWLKARPGYRGAPLLRPAFPAAFAACPLAFWFQEALRLGPGAEPMEEWPTTEEGLFIHRTLEKFFRPRLGRNSEPGAVWPGQADETAAQAELKAIFRTEAARTGRGPLGRPPLWRPRLKTLSGLLEAWLNREMAERESEARPWLLEWSFGETDETREAKSAAPPWPLRVGPEETIYFKGRLDRLDRTGRGLWARDYKRRDAPADFRVEEGRVPPRAWPLLIYALAAADHFRLPTDCSFEIIDPGEGPARRPGLASDHPAMNPDPLFRDDRLRSGDFSFPQLIAETWSAIKAGRFAAAASDAKSCERCAFAILCPENGGEPE